MILDLVIEAGNPADSDRLLSMLARHIDLYGHAPRQAAADGGFATRNSEGVGRLRHGLPQEGRPQDRRHGPQQLGLSQAPQLPRRHRSWHLLPQPRTAWRAAPGAGSTTSRLTSGPRWSLTISASSPASDPADATDRAVLSVTPASTGRYPMLASPRQALSVAVCTPSSHHAPQSSLVERPNDHQSIGKTDVYGRELAKPRGCRFRSTACGRHRGCD